MEGPGERRNYQIMRNDNHGGEQLVAEIHDRMPVVLEQCQFEPWLTGTAGLEVLKPAGDDVLQKCAVSKRVNSSRASDEDSTLIEPTELATEAPITSIQPSFI